jgi:hypothetical protein
MCNLLLYRCVQMAALRGDISFRDKNVMARTRKYYLNYWACIAHLTIEWYWSKFQREIIVTLKNSSHLEWRVGLSDTISNETTWPNGTKFGSKHLCKVLYKVSPFRSNWPTNMVAKINSFFLSLYRSPDNRMILKQISKGDNHYL